MRSYIRNIVFMCPDRRALASFYAELLGMRIIREDWLMIAKDERSFPRMAFDEVSGYRPPRWPDPAYPQQLHLDLHFDDQRRTGVGAATGRDSAAGHGWKLSSIRRSRRSPVLPLLVGPMNRDDVGDL